MVVQLYYSLHTCHQHLRLCAVSFFVLFTRTAPRDSRRPSGKRVPAKKICVARAGAVVGTTATAMMSVTGERVAATRGVLPTARVPARATAVDQPSGRRTPIRVA